MTLAWPSKDPNDIADYSNIWDLGTDTIATSTWIMEVAAGLTQNSASFLGNTATINLSGGTDGQTAIMLNRITTTGGRQYDSEPIYLPIVQTYPASAISGYNLPTAAYLIATFPAFAAVPPTVINAAITRAARSVDQTWTEGDYTNAIMLLACHYLVLSGQGTGAEAEVHAQGMAGFSMIRSGQLTLQRSATSQNDGGQVPGQFFGSVYGQQFYWLLKQNRPAVTIAGGTAMVGLDGMYPPYGSPARFNPWGN